MEQLQGSWQVVEAHVGGTHAPRESSEEQVWTFTRDKLAFDFGDSDPMEMTYRINEKQVPATIDLSPLGPRDKGNLYKGIYELDGDQLQVHFTRNSAADSRPTEFKPSGIDRGMRYFVLKRAPKPDAPAEKEKEPFTAWGQEVGGLQAGLGFKPGEKRRAYTHGETVTLVLRVRNVGKEDADFKHILAYFVENPPAVVDADGKPVHLPRLEAQGTHGPVSPKIAPGKAVELYEWKLELRPEPPRFGRNVRFSTLYGTGKFSLQCARIVGPTIANPQDPNPAMSELATGKLELEVNPASPPPAADAPSTVLQPAAEEVVQLKKIVGLAAIGGSQELSRLVELANQELRRKYPDLSDPIRPTDFYDGEVDHPSGKISVWFNYSIHPEYTDGQMVLLRISENGQPSIEQVILPRIVGLDEFEKTEWKMPNAEFPLPTREVDQDATKLAELGAKITALKQMRLKLSETLTPNHPRIRALDAEIRAVEKSRAALLPESPPANPGENMLKLPDDQYVKSGFPVDELVGEGVMWTDEQNGLSLGYRITGNEWRILGKKVKVELWVQNLGDKDVKFQLNMRPDIGLRPILIDAKGEGHSSNIWPNDTPPFGEHRLLPPGHALQVKEFTVSLLWPDNDGSSIKGHFFAIDPGTYNFHCELELPGLSATGEGGKQLTPAAGEWTGTLTTRVLNVEVIAPDAPAPKPRTESPTESEEVDISTNG